jgi:toxin ParE1/3/4
MKCSVRVLRRAERDLIEIAAWLERERPAVAAKHVDAILDALEHLADAPHRGARCHDDVLRARGFRFVVIRTWLVFYKIHGRQVRVMRVLHGKRDWLSLLRGR